MSTVQLQGRDTVGPEPTHQVTDSPDEGSQRVRPVLGRLRVTDEPRAARTRQASDVQHSRRSRAGCYDQRRSLLMLHAGPELWPVTAEVALVVYHGYQSVSDAERDGHFPLT